jgi:hypothetical protein
MPNSPYSGSDPSFEVQLQALWDAYVSVHKEHGVIMQKLDHIGRTAKGLSACWTSPIYADFEYVEGWFSRVAAELAELLQEIVNRLLVSYNNYHNAELTNLGNLETESAFAGSGPGHDDGTTMLRLAPYVPGQEERVEVHEVLLPYIPGQQK